MTEAMIDLAVQPQQHQQEEFTTAIEERNVLSDALRLPLSDSKPTGGFDRRAKESTLERWIYALLAAAFVGLFFFASMRYWVPAHPGVDQNGYLVGGRMLAENLTMR